jgi:hypothetical protein
MGQAVPTRVELPEHVGDASIMCPRVEGVTELLTGTVPAGHARIEIGQTADLTFYATWALPFDADAWLAG